MEHPRLLLCTVVWNHRDRLPLLLRSIEDQTHQADHVLVLDAASQDGVSAWLTQNYPQISTLRLFHRHSLSHAWRQAAKFALQRVPQTEQERSWIFFLSPEILLAKDVCERLLKEVERHPDAGALGPAVLRAWYQGEDEDGLDQIEPTELVDSLGTEPLHSFRWRQRGQGESLRSFEDQPTEVFALSSTAVAYRADKLTALLENGGLSLAWKTTEAMFFDLGWRLQWLEAKSYVLPDVLTWRVERKGDGTQVPHWTERVARDQDRRLLIRLHLFGAMIRVRTFFSRTFETVRVWPYKVWCALTRSSAKMLTSNVPEEKTALKQALMARDRYQDQAQITLRSWVMKRPLDKAQESAKVEQLTPSVDG